MVNGDSFAAGVVREGPDHDVTVFATRVEAVVFEAHSRDEALVTINGLVKSVVFPEEELSVRATRDEGAFRVGGNDTVRSGSDVSVLGSIDTSMFVLGLGEVPELDVFLSNGTDNAIAVDGDIVNLVGVSLCLVLLSTGFFIEDVDVMVG